MQEAVRRGLSIIAITDHDTTAGIAAALKHASENLTIIPGIELSSVSPQGEEVHILGLWIDPRYEPLQEQLVVLREARHHRIDKILKRLGDLGIFLTHDDILKHAQKDVLSRSHIASALMDKGVVKSKEEAFTTLIGQGAPAYVQRHKLIPEEAVQLLNQSGGVPVLAHPGLLKDLGILPSLIDAGLVGLEVVHPSHTPEQEQYFLKLAEDLGLLPSGGSDCHGPGGKDHIYIGKYTVPGEWVSALARRRGAWQ